MVLAALGMAATAHWRGASTQASGVPVASIRRGDLSPKIFATGELRASKSSTLSAPQIAGGALQITHLLRTGTQVKKDDVVVEFDPGEQNFKLDQSRSELEQASQEITKAKADAAVQASQDKVALLKARFDVRRAELEVEKNELVSTIDAKKNELALEQARRVLAQLEQDIKSHAISSGAGVNLAEEKLHKARLATDQARQNIEKMRMRAPIAGVIAVEKNMDSTGGMFWGQSLPDFREGDLARPGRPIARVIDPSDMEVTAKIDERDRSSVHVGQAAEIQLDALPGQIFSGTVKSISGMAGRDSFGEEQGGHFEVTLQMPGTDKRVRAGFTVQVMIAGDVRKDVLYVPRQAVFMKEGKHTVYIRNGTAFEARTVKVTAETESRAAVEGLNADTEIALVDPTATRKNSSSSSTGPTSGGDVK